MAASDTTAAPPATDTTTPADVAPATDAQVQDRAEQLVDAAAQRGNLQLSAEDRREIVDQVVQQLGPMLKGLSDEDCSRIVDMLIDRMASLGAFDQAPATTAPGATPAPEVAAEAAAEIAETQAPPEKLTWAERHFGNR